MKKSFRVAIDGPSSSGKSTVAKGVAKELGFFHIDSGAIYRALAWWIEHSLGTINNLDLFLYHIVESDGKVLHFVGDVEVTGEIRTPYISQKASELAVFPQIRKRVNELQREIAKGRSVVIEGRDIGSVVFPCAEVKVFLTANLEERSRRRFEELKQKGLTLSLEEIQKELLERDERDRTREDAPLIQAPDAQLIDTSNMSIGDVIQKIVILTKKRRVSFFWKLLMGEGRAHVSLPYKIVWLTAYAFLRLFYRLEIRGLENYPEGAAIIAPNHSSFLDPPAMGVACPGEVHCLAKAYLFKNRFIGSVLPNINTHPVSGDGSDLGVLKKIAELLSQGKQVIIFPEGTRSDDNQVKPLKRGVALLAAMTNCKVVPVGIRGAYEAWPRKNKFPRLWGKIIVTFGVPLEWKEYEKRSANKKEAQALFAKDLEESIKALGGKEKLQ